MRPFRHLGVSPFSLSPPLLLLCLALAGCAAPRPDSRMAAAGCLPGALDDLLMADRLMLGEETSVPIFSRQGPAASGRPLFMAQASCGPGTVSMASASRIGRGRMASMEGRRPLLSSPVWAPASTPGDAAALPMPVRMEVASY